MRFKKLLLLVFVLLLIVPTVSATWWNNSWSNSVHNTISNGTRPYQISLNISNATGTNNATYVYCNGKCNTNFTDIRFTLDNTTALPYWIEDNTSTGKVWVNVTANGTVNMYYGNPDATTTSNGTNTFSSFLNFEGTIEGFNVGSSETTYAKYNTYSYRPDVSDNLKTMTFPTKPFSVMMYIYPTSSVGHASIQIRWGNTKLINFRMSQGGNTGYYGYYDGSDHLLSTSTAVIQDAWTKIEFVLKSDTAYDIYINDLLKQSDAAYQSAATGNAYNFNPEGTEFLYVDGMILRQLSLIEPQWATWGTEQQSSISYNSNVSQLISVSNFVSITKINFPLNYYDNISQQILLSDIISITKIAYPIYYNRNVTQSISFVDLVLINKVVASVYYNRNLSQNVVITDTISVSKVVAPVYKNTNISQVFTITDSIVLTKIFAPTYIPPTPIIVSVVTGNFYVNTTWTAGAGNLTDSYNSTNTTLWINGSTASFRNSTLSPHAWQNMTISGFNNSGNDTLGNSISNNTQIPNNPIYITNILNTYTINEGQILSIDADETDADSDTPTFSDNSLLWDINPTTGVVSWSIGYTSVGVYNWNITVIDGYGSSSVKSFIVTVLETKVGFTLTSLSATPNKIFKCQPSAISATFSGTSITSAYAIFTSEKPVSPMVVGSGEIRPTVESTKVILSSDGTYWNGTFGNNENLLWGNRIISFEVTNASGTDIVGSGGAIFVYSDKCTGTGVTNYMQVGNTMGRYTKMLYNGNFTFFGNGSFETSFIGWAIYPWIEYWGDIFYLLVVFIICTTIYLKTQNVTQPLVIAILLLLVLASTSVIDEVYRKWILVILALGIAALYYRVFVKE